MIWAMPSLMARELWPMVGRSLEMEVFERSLSSGRHSGLVIYGRSGVGKTRLADECAEWAAAGGHPTQRVVGSRTTALLPLGAVVALLSGGLGPLDLDGQLDAVALFEDARRSLAERHTGRRLVTVADDVTLFDAASLALLGYLAAQGIVFLVATARTGEPVPDLVTDAWRDGRFERVDLDDLDRAQLDTLLHLVLGGPVEAGARSKLWELSRGNPLFVRELVLGALESRTLVERSGVWHLQNGLGSTRRLHDLVEQRIGGLTAAARSVIERLALCQPLELGYLETVTPAGVLESLELAGLVSIAVAEQEVRLAHPLHAEVVGAAIPSVRSRAILLAEADRLEDADPTGGAAMRCALWRLDAGGSPDPAILISGAHVARYIHDFRVVRRLIEAIPDRELDAVAALLWGEALYELGDFEACERVLAFGQKLPCSDRLAVRLALIRAKNANWGLCQPDAAMAVIAEAGRIVTLRPFVEELMASRASVLMFSGHPERALAVLAEIAGNEARTRALRAIPAAPALAATGQTAEAVAVAEAGFADHVALGDELAIANPGAHIINQVFALTEAGRLSQAATLAQTATETAASQRVPISQIRFASHLGRVATLQGRVATARRYYAEAEGLAAAHGFAGPRRLALGGLALANAMLGDAEAAARALAARETLPPFGFLAPEQQLADAWTAVADHRPMEAMSFLRRAAAAAAATGHLTVESWLLHDLMRVSGEDTSTRLGDLAGRCDSPLVLARARHAAAVRARDPKELAGAADDFEALGALLLAAEAAAGAADAFRLAGDPRAAVASARRSRALAAQCEGAVTPGLIQGETVVPLTRREREIARLAAEGLTSKDIADRMYLSVRTVDNHLQNVYSKLGVTSRAGLADALRSIS
jgi:DNA-binding CsgD family transcriptional regulator